MNKSHKDLHVTLTSALEFVEDGIGIALTEIVKGDNQDRFILTIANDLDEPFVFGFKYPDQVTVGQRSSRAFRLQRPNDLRDVRVLACEELAKREIEYASEVTGHAPRKIRVESVTTWFERALKNRQKVREYIESALAKIGPQ